MNGSATLLELLTPVIARTLSVLEALRSTGNYSIPAAKVHGELFNRLRVVRDEARTAGKQDAETYAAIFAVAAWTDEALARYPDWHQRCPALTAALFRTDRPGEEFHDRLAKLTRSQTELREVYFVILGLGFTGGKTPDEIDGIKGAQAALLDPAPLPPASLDRAPLTPQLYEAPAPAPARRAGQRRPVWTLALAGGGVATAALAAWSLWPAPAPEAGPEADRTRGVIDLVVAGYQCARITTTLRDDRVVEVDGYVASTSDRQRLGESLRNIEGVTTVLSRVEIYPWPFCQVIGTLSELAWVEPGRAGMPSAQPDRPALDYAVGDSLIVRATATSRFRGYLYVDLIAEDGSVLHLLPEPLQPYNLLDAGAMVVLGTPAGQARATDRQWTLDPPPGMRMLLALATPVPLFDNLRPERESAGDYLPALHEALQSLSGLGRVGALPATMLLFDLRPAQPVAAARTG